MTIEVRTMNSIQAAIQAGMTKEECQHVTDEETSKFWDRMVAEMAKMDEFAKKRNLPPPQWDFVKE